MKLTFGEIRCLWTACQLPAKRDLDLAVGALDALRPFARADAERITRAELESLETIEVPLEPGSAVLKHVRDFYDRWTTEQGWDGLHQKAAYTVGPKLNEAMKAKPNGKEG